MHPAPRNPALTDTCPFYRRAQSRAPLLRGTVGLTVAEGGNPGARETQVEIPALPFLVLGDLGQVMSSTSASAPPLTNEDANS